MSEHHEPPHTPEDLKEALHEHDDWFRHGPDEPHHQKAHGDFNPYVVMTFLAVTAVGVFGTAALVITWMSREIHAEVIATDRQREASYVAEYASKRAQWDQALTGEPTWINEQENVVRIPIELAMERVAEDYGSKGR